MVRSVHKSAKEAILDAAVSLVETTGAGQLTFDAVAVKAGISKGGLLHHFKSKDALLVGMIGRLAADFDAEWKAARDGLDVTASGGVERDIQLISAYLDRSFSGIGVRSRSAMTLLAVASHEPSLMQPIRDYFNQRATETMAGSASPMAMVALMMFADGLWLFDALGIAPVEGELRSQMAGTVKQWARHIIEADARQVEKDTRQ